MKSAAADVVIYARYSTDRQDARSIDDQVRRCRGYAADRELTVRTVYQDAAQSGAHLDRVDMQRLLRHAQGGAFAAVLVDDLSRLSRDLGNTWRIVFEELAAVNVRVIDVTTGMASDGAGARLTFGAMALVNDTFLQLVRAETHRGMEGRAIAGFSTGGRTYGYSAVTEENPPDPEHPRKRAVIDDAEAYIVVRIFRLFAEGASLKGIAATLNAEGLAAPNDGGRGNKIGRGWPHTTIRAILRNERYTGKVVWNASKWVRVPGRKARRRVARPESEWNVARYDELRIVPEELWEAVQARFARRASATRRGPLPGSGRHASLLTGMLRCGTCNGSMTGVSRRVKNGVTYMNFGCTAHFARGASICANGAMISEIKATTGIIGALQRELTAPGMADRFVEVFNRRRTELERQAAKGGASVADQVREAERRVRNLTEALAKVGWSDALAATLREEEARLTALKTQATSDRRGASAPVPHARLVESYLANLFALLARDKQRGREVLARHMSPVLMTPIADDDGQRYYLATTSFNLAISFGKNKTPPGVEPGGVVVFRGSGGPHEQLTTTIPVTEKIAIGRGK